ncbi:unnamed protein product, partial [Toxocara canis]
STSSEDIQNASFVLDQQPGPSNVIVKEESEPSCGSEIQSQSMKLLKSVRVKSPPASSDEGSEQEEEEDAKENNCLLFTTDSSTLPENSSGCRRSARVRKRPACYETETEEETVRATSRKKQRKRVTRSRRAARNGAMTNPNSPDSSDSHTANEGCGGLETRSRRNGRGKRTHSTEEQSGCEEEESARKRLRPRASQKAINYCENESDDECVVYTTSVSARGRLRRHKAYS